MSIEAAIFAPGDCLPASSVRNCILGTIVRTETASIHAEIVLDIGNGMTLATAIPAESARKLGLSPGKRAFARFDAARVIIATD